MAETHDEEVRRLLAETRSRGFAVRDVVCSMIANGKLEHAEGFLDMNALATDRGPFTTWEKYSRHSDEKLARISEIAAKERRSEF